MFVPLHAPPHDEPSVAHAGRPPTGLPVTGEHLPADPGRLHAWHCPPHPVSQHTPSTQLPLTHPSAFVHAAPFCARAWHVPPLHQSPDTQSPSPPQLVLQAFAPHTYGVHALVTGAGQCPCPSQLAAAVCVPPEQLAFRHDEVGYVQVAVVVPLQVPPHDVPSVAQAGRPPTGFPVTGEHVPTFPVTLHAWH